VGEEQKQEEVKPEAPSLMGVNRAKFEEHFESAHEPTDSQESESEAPTVKEEQSDSSSVKEEIKGGEQKEEKPVDKTDELLKNKEKALHEEREKRKQANLRLRELQEKLKAMEDKINSVVASKDAPDEVDSDDPKVSALTKRLQEIEERDRRAEMQRQQTELQEKVAKTDKALKEEGYPGFRYGINRVDEELKRMFAEGEIDEQDYLDPQQWKEVYKSKVYEEVSAEFKAIQKQETIESRLDKKKAAAQVPGNPGSKPEAKKEDSSNEPDTDSMSEYIAFRKKNSAKTGR
jgi:hypothetical protein